MNFLCNLNEGIFKHKAPFMVQAVAHQIFHMVQKKLPFSEYDHLTLSVLSVYLACKQ